MEIAHFNVVQGLCPHPVFIIAICKCDKINLSAVKIKEQVKIIETSNT